MALLFRAGCMLAVLCLVTAQTNEDLDHLISQVFPETGENTTTKNPPSTGEGINLTSSNNGTDNCTCVPYYLCKPSPVFINWHIPDTANPCENSLDVCCASGDIVDAKPESDRPVQNFDHLISQIFSETGENTTTKNPHSTGEGIILIPSTTGDGESVGGTGNCTCVPYYLCKPDPNYRTPNNPCENYLDICCASGDIVEAKPVSDRPVQN